MKRTCKSATRSDCVFELRSITAHQSGVLIFDDSEEMPLAKSVSNEEMMDLFRSLRKDLCVPMIRIGKSSDKHAFSNDGRGKSPDLRIMIEGGQT